MERRALLTLIVGFLLLNSAAAGPLAYAACQAACGVAVAACFTAAGATWGTVPGAIMLATPALAACSIKILEEFIHPRNMYANSPNTVSPQAQESNEMIRMTPEEERIYKECNKEGFIKKGIPYGSMAAISTFAAMKAGFIKTNPMFGYYPILATAGCLGAFVGIISHKATCVQKVLDLPNSHLKQMVDASLKRLEHQTARQKGLISDEIYMENQSPLKPALQMDDYQPPGDFDTFTGVHTDSDQRDDFFTMEPLDKFAGASTTYDELRQKNREEYMRSQLTRPSPDPYNSRMGGPQPPPAFPPAYPGSNLPFDRDRVPQYQLND